MPVSSNLSLELYRYVYYKQALRGDVITYKYAVRERAITRDRPSSPSSFLLIPPPRRGPQRPRV